jgi:hypothetical protein
MLGFSRHLLYVGGSKPLESIKKLGVAPPGALLPAAELDTSVGTLPRVPDSAF